MYLLLRPDASTELIPNSPYVISSHLVQIDRFSGPADSLQGLLVLRE